MKKIRLIPRLEIKGENLIKGVQLEGLRIVGDPISFASDYYKEGADELIYSDVVASLYGRNSLLDMVAKTASKIFIPLTVGGGITSIEDVENLLRHGADKVSLNTGAINRPALVSDIANRFGSQCCVLEIQAKQMSNGSWQAFFENGRERSNLDAVQWAVQGAALGAGELLVTSVDRDGTRLGMDVELIEKISANVDVPVIASGGVGSLDDILQVSNQTQCEAICLSDFLHFKRGSLREIKALFVNSESSVRA